MEKSMKADIRTRIAELRTEQARLEKQLVDRQSPTFIAIEPGTVGTEDGDEITVDGYRISETAITVGQWRVFLEESGHEWDRLRRFDNLADDLPITNVTYFDAVAFCEFYSYSLPTCDQWEYACRAGSAGRYCCPDKDLSEYAVYGVSQVQAVATKRPNKFGLYDMHGNVWEWTKDSDPQTNRRLLRGGSWAGGSFDCRATNRNFSTPGGRTIGVGFHVVCGGQDAKDSDPQTNLVRG